MADTNNGTFGWDNVSLPFPIDEAKGTWLGGISCTGRVFFEGEGEWDTFCMAVGRAGPATGTAGLLSVTYMDGQGWKVLPTMAGEQAWYDVSCASPTTCVAVGTSGSTAHWDGSKWTYRTQAINGGLRNGVSCPSIEMCIAVGNASGAPLAERWDGEKWSAISVPDPEERGVLQDIECVSAVDCTAAYEFRDEIKKFGEVVETEPMTLKWGGEGFAIEPAAFSAQRDAEIFKISCLANSRCMAAGVQNSAAAPMLQSRGWDAPTVTAEPASGVSKSNATVRASVNPEGLMTSYQFEYGTTTAYGSKSPASPKSLAAGSTDVAVSENLEGLNSGATYHYRLVAINAEGTTYGKDEAFTTWGEWSTQETVDPPPPSNPIEATLEGVSCFSSTLCAAVGENKKEGKAFGEIWNGSKWEALSEGKSGFANGSRYGVACISATLCRAVGTTSGGTSVAENWTLAGSLWLKSTQSTPNPEGGSAVKLRDISCTASSACTAVGSYVKEGATKTLAQRYNGTWSIQTTPNPGSGNAELRGVSCDSSTSCMAVGKNDSGPYAARWNGSSWSATTVPTPAGAATSSLEKVSCTSSSNCMAVGTYKESTGYNKTYTARWNGSAWSVTSSPNPAEAKGSYLLGVSCASANSCSAVGYYATELLGGLPTKSKTLALSWGGSEWAIQSSPNPGALPVPRLNGVSCTAADACTAVGYQGSAVTSNEGSVTLGLRYE